MILFLGPICFRHPGSIGPEGISYFPEGSRLSIRNLQSGKMFKKNFDQPCEKNVLLSSTYCIYERERVT